MRGTSVVGLICFASEGQSGLMQNGLHKSGPFGVGRNTWTVESSAAWVHWDWTMIQAIEEENEMVVMGSLEK